jgi:drug/metabolite transporter (DMT)-like permease
VPAYHVLEQLSQEQREMLWGRVREYLVLFALAALWGASFLFIRIAVTEVSPLMLVGARFVIATLGLLLVVPFQPAIIKGWRGHLWGFFVVAVFNAIIPYLAISWGEQYVPSGMSAIFWRRRSHSQR